MLQRVQTIWLLLAAVAGLLSFRYSFFSGNKVVGPIKSFQYLDARSTILLVVFSVSIICIAAIAIFLYKNRKLQFRLTLLALVLSLVNIYLYFRETENFVEGNYDLTALLPIAIPIFLFLANRGIYKDQKLVKNLDRLR